LVENAHAQRRISQRFQEGVSADDLAELTGMAWKAKSEQSTDVLINSLNALTTFAATASQFGSVAFHLVDISEPVAQQLHDFLFSRSRSKFPEDLAGMSFQAGFQMAQPISFCPVVVFGTVV
jgi:hypothetical protein